MEYNKKCNNCGSNDKRILFKENKAQINQIVQCENCGLMFVFPLTIDPDQEYWEGSSQKEKEISDFDIHTEHFSFMVEQKERLQVDDYLSSLKFVEKHLNSKGHALEIGSSRGYFLNALQNAGWITTGIEPSDHRRNEAKILFGFDFIPDKLEDSPLLENTYDAIFLFHVIEHVLDPSNFISLLYKYLRPGGVLVMETPTYDTLSFKLLKHRERSIRCNGHFFFFTKQTLRELTEKSGFITIRHDRVGRTLTVERLLWNVAVIAKNSFLEKLLAKISKYLKLGNLKIYLKFGDMQRLYSTK